jgi:hypothetical protein
LNPSAYTQAHALSVESAASGTFYYELISSNEAPTVSPSQCTHAAELNGEHYQVAKCKGFKGSVCRHGLRWSLIDTGATLSWDAAAAKATTEGGSVPTLAQGRLILAQRIGKVAYTESDWTDDKQNGVAAGSLSGRTGVWVAVSNEAETGAAKKQWMFVGLAENSGLEESQKLFPGKAAASAAAPSAAHSTFALVVLPYSGAYVENQSVDTTHPNGKGEISRSNGCTYSAGAVAVKGNDEAKAAFYIQAGEQLGATGAQILETVTGIAPEACALKCIESVTACRSFNYLVHADGAASNSCILLSVTGADAVAFTDAPSSTYYEFVSYHQAPVSTASTCTHKTAHNWDIL